MSARSTSAHSLRERGRKISDAQSHFLLPRAARVGKVARNAPALRDGRGLSPAKGPLRLARTDVRVIHLPPFASRTGEETHQCAIASLPAPRGTRGEGGAQRVKRCVTEGASRRHRAPTVSRGLMSVRSTSRHSLRERGRKRAGGRGRFRVQDRREEERPDRDDRAFPAWIVLKTVRRLRLSWCRRRFAGPEEAASASAQDA
jgi:hypothetical protein